MIAPRIVSWEETPPHTRGNLSSVVSQKLNLRNTPAYAGKSEARPFYFHYLQKHPRIRGEIPYMLY